MSALSERINAANHQGWNSRQVEARAKKAGHTLSNGTAFKILRGTHGAVTDDTLHALADVFGLKFDELRNLVGLPAGDEPWVPPVASSRLTSIQRELLEALIHQLVRPTESEGASHGKAPEKIGDFLEGRVEDIPSTDPKQPAPRPVGQANDN